MMLSVILLSILPTLYSNQASGLKQQLELASELESDLWDTGAGSSLLVSMLEKLN